MTEYRVSLTTVSWLEPPRLPSRSCILPRPRSGFQLDTSCAFDLGAAFAGFFGSSHSAPFVHAFLEITAALSGAPSSAIMKATPSPSSQSAAF